ncbi:hypothetical protein PIB30_109600, partial [Stylosanthes scabra]|nr:hypothetical protein [Stylosanthes scabra]
MAVSNPQENDALSSETTPKLDPFTRIHLSKAKLAVEIFDGMGHFSMWQGEVLDA